MQKIINTYAITLALISLTSYTVPATAQSEIAMNNPDSLRVHFVQQPQLPDNGTPTGRRKGAAGRGNCSFEPPLTALVPESEKTLPEDERKTTYVWGKTIAERPTFWFYVPYSQTSLVSAEFVLQDGEDDVYRAPVTLPRTPGIVSIRLPSTLVPLKVGKMYHWFFKVNVDCASPPSNIKDYVEGWVQRVTLPSLTRKLKTATIKQRIALYAANGIWYDALTSVADLRLVDSNALIKEDWTGLLQSVGLSNIASKPIVQCCNFENAYSFQEIRTIKPLSISKPK